MKIVILTEGGNHIGFGHLSRCCALAEEFKNRKWQVDFVINRNSAASIFLRNKGMRFIEFNWLRDISRVLDIIRGKEIILIDSYLAPRSFYHRVYRERGCSLLSVLGDYNRLDYLAGVIINSSVSKDTSRWYKNKARTKYLAGKKLTDGLGTKRIANYLIRMANSLVTLSHAHRADCTDLWKWRNTIKVRKWCFNKKKISFLSHKKWFFTSLKDPLKKIFVAKRENDKIGVIRFERNAAAWMVNVNLNPCYLNQGFGSKVITLGTEKIIDEMKVTSPIIAKIMPGNRASISAFANAGYVLRPTKDKDCLSMIFHPLGRL